MLVVDTQTEQARAKWQFRGQRRPEFAEPVGPGEESVWDFPRPPGIEPIDVQLQVLNGKTLVARTTSGLRVLETAGAPTYYFPPEDVDEGLLEALTGRSLCEWKGPGISYVLRSANKSPADPVAWCYPETYPEFESICGWYGFYPSRLRCFVGSERATAQPGRYYGGWVTDRLKGPIKGEPGTEHW